MTGPEVRVLDPSPAPGSPAWSRIMTASKVAAVVGLSPWESRFSLWHLMSGKDSGKPQTEEMARGHYLEPAVRTWHADQVKADGVIVMPGDGMTLRDGWMGATPDGFTLTKEEGMIGITEYKTSLNSDDWGKTGSDEIAPYYKPQVQWGMHVTGAKRCSVAVILERFEFRLYQIEYEAKYASWLEDESREFMDSLPGGPKEKRPDIDDSLATYECVRRIHPDIDPDVRQEIPWDLVQKFTAADRSRREAESQKREAVSKILDIMGKAKYGTVGPENIFRRQAAGKTVALHTVKPKVA